MKIKTFKKQLRMKKWLITAAILIVLGVGAYLTIISLKDESGGLGIKSSDGVCIVDGAALKDAPGKDGAFIATVNLGEKMTLQTSKEIETSKGTTKYYKVKLNGGSEGWLKESCVINAAKPAAVVDEAIVYSRPDLITQTQKKFSPLDITAVVMRQGDFVKVYGKTKDGRKVKGGWVKFSSLSFEDVDVAVAIYVAKANTKKTNEDRITALKEIVANPDFSSSRFIPELTTLTEDAPANIPVEEETPDSTVVEE